MFVYLKYIQCAKTCKNVQKRASQVLTYQKTCISRSHLPKNVQKTCKNVQKCAKTCKNLQKRASQMFLDPIQKRALSRSVHLEAVYLEALLYNSLPEGLSIVAARNFQPALEPIIEDT